MTKATNTFTFHFHDWRRKWQPTPVFLPGESQGRGSLMGYSLWGLTELDMAEVTWQQHHDPFAIYCFVFEFIHPFCVSCLEKIL